MTASTLAQLELGGYAMAGFALLAFVVVALLVASRWIVVGNPSELLVISGNKTGDKGYR